MRLVIKILWSVAGSALAVLTISGMTFDAHANEVRANSAPSAAAESSTADRAEQFANIAAAIRARLEVTGESVDSATPTGISVGVGFTRDRTEVFDLAALRRAIKAATSGGTRVQQSIKTANQTEQSISVNGSTQQTQTSSQTVVSSSTGDSAGTDGDAAVDVVSNSNVGSNINVQNNVSTGNQSSNQTAQSTTEVHTEVTASGSGQADVHASSSVTTNVEGDAQVNVQASSQVTVSGAPEHATADAKATIDVSGPGDVVADLRARSEVNGKVEEEHITTTEDAAVHTHVTSSGNGQNSMPVDLEEILDSVNVTVDVP